MRLPSPIPRDAIESAAESGLDIAVPCVAQRYNALVKSHGQLMPIETFGRAQTSALLVGNTRALWPALKRAVAREPEVFEQDPVDRYVERTISKLQRAILSPSRIYYGHVMGPEMVSMLHAAQASGFADHGPAHLAVHPNHGPWFALRALIIVDHPGEIEEVTEPKLCTGCPAPCVSALNDAMRTTELSTPKDGLGRNWPLWVAIRDACPHGKGARYSDAQIRYHYASDDTGLRDP